MAPASRAFLWASAAWMCTIRVDARMARDPRSRNDGAWPGRARPPQAQKPCGTRQGRPRWQVRRSQRAPASSRERSPAPRGGGAELPRVSHGVWNAQSLLRQRRGRVDRGTSRGAVFPGDDLPHLPEGLRPGRKLLPRRRRRAGPLWALWSRHLDQASDESRFPQNLPGMWGAPRFGARVLRPRWNRAGGGQLASDRGRVMAKKRPKDDAKAGSNVAGSRFVDFLLRARPDGYDPGPKGESSIPKATIGPSGRDGGDR